MPGNQYYVEQVNTDEIDIDEQLALHEKSWVIQKVGWFFIIGIMVVGLLGLFGEGIMSEKKISKEGVSVTFEKFYRYEAEMRVLVESDTHISSISFPQDYLREFRILRVECRKQQNNTNTENGYLQIRRMKIELLVFTAFQKIVDRLMEF
jgi:hypothetical protein